MTGKGAFLAFSGGRDSVVLEHMLRNTDVTLLWVNTGQMFPHMRDWVHSFAQRHPLIELPSDQAAQWSEFGLPADVLPVANAMPGGMHQEPKLQAWVTCCSMLRAKPIVDHLSAIGEPVILVHGQRHDDRAPGLGLSGAAHMLPAGSDILAPLAGWSDDRLQEYVDHHALELPEQYPGVDSLECRNCPAAFHGEMGRRRLGYMAERHPDQLRAVAPMVEVISRASRGALSQTEALLEIVRAPHRIDAPISIVPQRTRGMGDCALAALATVIGRDYDETANLMGYQIDDRGWPILPAGGGLANVEMAAALLALGYSGTLITTCDHPANAGQAAFTRSPTMAELKDILRGERAVLMTQQWFDGVPQMHAMPWIDGMAYDCRPPVAACHYEQLSVAAAMVIRPAQAFPTFQTWRLLK